MKNRLKDHLEGEMRTFLVEDAADFAAAWNYETDSYKCRRKDKPAVFDFESLEGSVFDSTSYQCEAKCRLYDDDSEIPIQKLYSTLTEKTLPAMHSK